MAKLTLVDLASLQNETTAIQTINSNNALIEQAIENSLSRDGTLPNQLEADLDVNSQRVINLATPEAGTDAARLIDIQDAAFPTIVIPSLAGNGGKILTNDTTVLNWQTPTSITGIGDLKSTNNLSELTDKPTARTTLGLGTAAVTDIGTSGDTVPKLNGTNTWSATQTFTGIMSSSGGFVITGAGDLRVAGAPTILYTDSVGFRGAPQNIKDAAYIFALLDAGKSVVHTVAGAHTWIIPPNSFTAFPLGTTIVLNNTGAGVVTIAPDIGVTLRLGGAGTTGNRSLSQHGLATIYKASTDIWYISGSGVS